MKMIPEAMPNRNDPKMNGERLVFDMLSRLDLDGIVLHSLLQKNHRYKMIGEVDFLVICKYGIICIEVKGGVIKRTAGEWTSTSGKGVVHSIQNPFSQAKDCHYATRNYVKDKYPEIYYEAEAMYGYCVVFPECEFKDTGNDLVTEVLFDARKKADDLGDFLKTVYDHWKKEEEVKHGFSPKMMNNGTISKFTDIFRKDISAVPSLKLNIQNIEQQFLELTEEQFDVLESCEENRHIIVTGAAGTGKSVLAVEQFRRMIEKGTKTAYICFNKNMALSAKDSLKSIPSDCFVGTYHGLLMPGGNDDEAMPTIKDISRNSEALEEKYDYLIVDEAQDLFCIEVLDNLEKILCGGLKNGNWMMFMDKKQNIFGRNDDFDFADEYIRSECSPAYFPLNVNCRNTKQIGRRNALLTQTEHAKYLKIDGEIVGVHQYKDRNDFLSLFKYELQNLLTWGMSINDIVILSKHRLENSLLNGIEKVCNYFLNAPLNISYAKKNQLNYYTVHSFKGLESKVVFLIDVDGFEGEYNRAVNYVGMSRAKVLLKMFLPEQIMNDYRDLTS